MKIQIINGPNLNLLGQREEDLYGKQSFEEHLDVLKQLFESVDFTYFQSNHEGEIIDSLQQSEADGIILNAGGYTHTSVAIRDAISAISTPVVEVHMTNIYARETFRQTSVLTDVCIGCIAGFGMQSYSLAVTALLEKLKN